MVVEWSQGFEPVFDERARLLILGSHPGVPSLKKGQYYGNPGNAFWRVVFAALQVEDPLEYGERLAVLQAHGIALWDVYGQAEREGSYDHKISEWVLNDFSRVLKAADIGLIIANGQTAFKETQKHPIFADYEVASALSTSGLNNGREAERMAQWTQLIRQGLGRYDASDDRSNKRL